MKNTLIALVLGASGIFMLVQPQNLLDHILSPYRKNKP